MTRLRADLAQLEELVADLTAFERRLDEAQGALGARMRQLHAQWSGVAAAEQAEAHRRWSAAAAQLQAALATLRQSAAVASANYQAAVSAGRRMWSR
jgi:WXG100 family type VII secretion target